MGNLTRDPETRVASNGNTICKFGLATTRVYKTQDGEQKEDATFVDIDSFGRQAEVISKYFNKGKPILVEGRLKLDQWQDKQSGQNRSKLGVVLESFSFVGNRNDGGGSSGGAGAGAGGGQPNYESSAPPSRNAAPGNTTDEPDDDVPF